MDNDFLNYAQKHTFRKTWTNGGSVTPFAKEVNTRPQIIY